MTLRNVARFLIFIVSYSPHYSPSSNLHQTMQFLRRVKTTDSWIYETESAPESKVRLACWAQTLTWKDAIGPDWHTIVVSDYQNWLYHEMEFAVDGIHNVGVKRVMWLTLPANVGYEPSQRLMIFNKLAKKLASTCDWMTIVDYATYIWAHNEWRPDGIHVSQEMSLLFVETLLADQINESALTTAS